MQINSAGVATLSSDLIISIIGPLWNGTFDEWSFVGPSTCCCASSDESLALHCLREREQGKAREGLDRAEGRGWCEAAASTANLLALCVCWLHGTPRTSSISLRSGPVSTLTLRHFRGLSEHPMWVCRNLVRFASNRSWFLGSGFGQQLFNFWSPAVHWMARTSSLNCLSCRNPYQTPHSLNPSPLFTENPFFFIEKCFVTSPSQESAPI